MYVWGYREYLYVSVSASIQYLNLAANQKRTHILYILQVMNILPLKTVYQKILHKSSILEYK